ncbi:MAG: phosphatase PAP2 family protein [Rhodanobacteraceae bacterium]
MPRHARRDAWPLLPAIVLIAAGCAGLLSGRAHQWGAHILLSMRHPADPSQLLGPAWLQETIRDFAALGGIGVLVVFIGASLGVLWLSGKRGQAWWFLGGVIGAFVIASVLKHLIGRPRPHLIPHEAYTFTASFPSGNTLMATVVWLLIALAVADASGQRLTRWFAVAVALLLALLVGAGRVYLGVHWPGDVLAAWGIGIAWVWLLRRAQPRGINAPM